VPKAIGVIGLVIFSYSKYTQTLKTFEVTSFMFMRGSAQVNPHKTLTRNQLSGALGRSTLTTGDMYINVMHFEKLSCVN